MVPTPDVSLADTRRTIVWIRMITIGILTAIALSIAGATVGQEQVAPNALIFTQVVEGDTRIFMSNPDGSNVVALDQVNNPFQYGAQDGDLSSDGTTLVFSAYSDYVPPGGYPPKEIYTYNFATETLTQLTNDGLDNYQPIWSPDGSRIAHFSRGIAGVLSITDVSTGVTVDASFLWDTLDQYGYVTGFDWSPSGEELVASIQMTGPGAYSSLYLVEPNEESVSNLLPAGMTGTMPAWNDTGSDIYYVCDGLREICRYSIQNQTIQQLTNFRQQIPDTGIRSFDVSTQGEIILRLRSRDPDEYSIARYNSAANELLVLYRSPEIVGMPRWAYNFALGEPTHTPTSSPTATAAPTVTSTSTRTARTA